jgi:hypothetical protein
MIWTEQFLQQLSTDAEQDINKRIPSLIYFRFCLTVTQGISVYTLPSYVRTVSRVTWLGRKLDPVNWDELIALTPATVVLNANQPDTVPTVIGRPLYYAKHPTHPYDIRLFPTPNLTLSSTAQDPYSPLPESATQNQACIVACWRAIDSTFQDPTALLPAYIDRRMRKAYVLWKAFEAEGKGQKQIAAMYYKKIYEILIEKFIQINQGAYVSKRYAIENGALVIDGFRYPRPILPSNFEMIRF